MRGDAGQATVHYRRAIRVAGQAVDEDPQNGFARLQMASAEFGLALSQQDGPPAAVREACETLRRVRTFWKALEAKGELPSGERAELPRLETALGRCPSGR
jgi:hypothetical protein